MCSGILGTGVVQPTETLDFEFSRTHFEERYLVAV